MFSQGRNILSHDGEVYLIPDLFSEDECRDIFNGLFRETPWKHDEGFVFGRHYVSPRMMAWYGDEGAVYRYSGILRTPLEWSELLLRLKARVEKECGQSFNSCLLNYYPDGNAGMGWHRDDEPELGPAPVIASLSFGSTRKFSFRHDRTGERVDILLDSGTLLLMQGATQKHWKHSLPKSLRINSPRVNLTFRKIAGV